MRRFFFVTTQMSTNNTSSFIGVVIKQEWVLIF